MSRARVCVALVAGGLILPTAAWAQAPAAGKDPVAGRPAPPSVNVFKEMKQAVKEGVGGAVNSVTGAVRPGAVAAGASAPAVPGVPRPPGVATPPAAASGVVAVPTDPVERLAFLRRKVLRDDDFVDNDDINRDPFRSFLRLFVEKPAARVQQVPAIFEKFALEELALIAVVSGDANPRAMFRDPGGFGQTVKRGDYVSKSAARITKILSDRVIFELTEMQPTGESRAIEKAVLVNPEGSRR